MKNFKDSINNFISIDDGIWTFDAGYTVAKNKNLIGIRMDLDFLEGNAEGKLILDFTLNGNIKNSFIAKGNNKTIIYENQIKDYLDKFNQAYKKSVSEGIPLLDVKQFFKK